MDEEARAAQFRADAAARAASIQSRLDALTAPPAPFLALTAAWQPVVDWQLERLIGPVPTPEELQDQREREHRRQVAMLPGLGSAALTLYEEDRRG